MPRNSQFTGKRKKKGKQEQKKAQVEYSKMKMAEKVGVTIGKLKSFLAKLVSPKHGWSYKKTPNAKRPCTACGRPHTHNNAFCSAFCKADFKRLFKTEGGYNVLRKDVA